MSNTKNPQIRLSFGSNVVRKALNLNVFGLILTWGVWIGLASRKISPLADLMIACGGALVMIPIVMLGRLALDVQPNVARAQKITTIIHYFIAAALGSAILSATRFALESSSQELPVPAWLGIFLMIIGGLLLLLAIFNLILKGLGAPFAIALTRAVVTDWLYAWTRNPMILSALALLVGLGVWLRSGLFLIWLLVVVTPAVLVFIKYYEERELEIRFGEEYLEYKAKTPRLLPRKP